MNKIIARPFVFLLVFRGLASLQAQTVDENLWATNGPVDAIVRSDNTIFVGGGFTRVGPATGCGAAIDINTGTHNPAFAKVNGEIRAVVSDGSGGWYVGGDFTTVGGVTRNHLAHIEADGMLDASWNPNPNGSVLALAVSASTVYVGGTFTTIGGQTRNKIAALDTVTGSATSWNPNAAGVLFAETHVQVLAVSGSIIYAGGDFTTIGGQPRNGIAALDAASGTATSWNPNPNERTWALAVSGSTIYAGGVFTTIGGQARNYIAALDSGTGSATSWNPNVGGIEYIYVSAISVSGSTVYVGGEFTSIGGAFRNNIAAVDAVTGIATNWNPNATGYEYGIVSALVVSGSTVYAGGFFTNIGGQSRNAIATLDSATGAATSWDPHPSGGGAVNYPTHVSALAVFGSTVYAGGLFTMVGGETRNNVAAIDAVTGAATSWNPNADGYVFDLAVSGSTVYAGGYFTSIGGQSRNHIAALDATTGTATSWNPNAGGGLATTVVSLAVSGSTVYAGGNFTSIGGQPRNGIAALDSTTGMATSWNPDANSGAVLAVSGSMVYVGGGFTIIGGQPRNYIAALDAVTGAATSWNPNADGPVEALAVSGSTVYAGGIFSNIGGQQRNYIAALDTATGTATSWNPNPTGGFGFRVYVLTVSGSTVYVGGEFTTIGGQTRKTMAALDAISGNATAWNPNPRDLDFPVVSALAVFGSTVYAGGKFTTIGNSVQSFFAGITADVTSVTENPVLPREFVLHQNYPNPFNPLTTIRFEIPKASHVTLTIHNLLGQEIETLVDDKFQAGTNQVTWNANGLPSGVYFCRIRSDAFSQTRKVVLLK